MELLKINAPDRIAIINSVLNHTVGPDEKEEIIENVKLYFEDGSDLYSINEKQSQGFFIVSTYKEGGVVEELILDEFYLSQDVDQEVIADTLSSGIKKLHKSIRPEKVEVVLPQNLLWLGKELSDHGFIAEMIKLEKLLPNPKYLGDVLELIDDSIPKDRVSQDMILQVLLEKDDEYQTQIIDTADELEDMMEDDWVPIMVVLSFEPLDQQINEIIGPSHKLVNWDDFEIIYTL